MTIGELIENRRKELGLTLEAVGASVGVSKATVSRWESGDIHKMKRDKIAALSDVLGIDPIVFLSDPEIITPEERRLLTAYRAASPDSREDALMILERSAEKNKEKVGHIASKAIS